MFFFQKDVLSIRTPSRCNHCGIDVSRARATFLWNVLDAGNNTFTILKDDDQLPKLNCDYIQRLEQKGVIESDWQITENNRRAKYYRLTTAGRRAVGAETASWRLYVEAVELILDIS